MALSTMPLSGMAMQGIGNLVQRRRAMAGGSFGMAMNTRQIPTNTVSTGATDGSMNTGQTPAGQANGQIQGGTTNLTSSLGQSMARRKRRNLGQAPLSGQALQT